MDLRVFVEPQQGASYADQLQVARHAEDLGFEGFFRSDHFLLMDEWARPGSTGEPGPTDAWTTLAGLARETSRIRLGALVTSATFRHPGLLAIQVAGVDAMSSGRVELGLGAGWYAAEHAAYGVPFPDAPERFDRIVPCGLTDATVTSLSQETGRDVTVAEATPYVEKRLVEVLRAG